MTIESFKQDLDAEYEGNIGSLEYFAPEKYRFENGSLFEYNELQNAYIHCYKNAFNNTRAKAVAAYEQLEDNTND